MSSRRSRISLLGLGLTLAAGGHASAQIALDASRPFHRFADESEHAVPGGPTAVNVGWDYWTGLEQQKPVMAVDVRVPVDTKNTFRLGDLIDPAKLSRDAMGVVVAVETVFGRNHHYVTTRGAANPADIRLYALAPDIEAPKEQRVKSASAWAREVFPLPREFRSAPIAIPASGARLSFGVGFEDLLEQLGVRTLTDAIDGDGRRTFAVRARILVEVGGAPQEIFSQELRSNTAQANHRRFQHFAADLSAYAGKTVNVVFRFEPLGKDGDACAFGIPLWGNPVLLANETPSPKKNLLIISLDTLRADHLGCYGYTRDTSPNIDAFAADATLFEECLSTASWTTPAHASAFTGLSSVLHGAGGPAGFRLRNSATTLAELARANGYLTAAFTQGHAISGSFGFAQGFDQYSEGPESGMPAQSNGVAGDLFAQGRAWLDEFGKGPFFLFMHTYEIHAPYIPPDPFHGRFTKEPIGDGTPAKRITAPADRERIEALYDEGIAYTDHVLGEFFAYLKDSGLLDRTNVIIMSDHGEEFWDHGSVQHSFTLFQEQLHVPLIVRFAGAEPPKGRVAQRVSLADVFATSVSLLGIEHTPPRDSISLVPLVLDHAAPYPRTLFRFELYKTKENYFVIAGLEGPLKYSAKTFYDRADSPLHTFVNATGQPLAAGELALLETLDPLDQSPPNIEELFFDLSADPGEHSPLAPSPAMRALRRALLDDLRKSSEEARQRLEAAGLPSELTDTEREQLRSLGYVD